MAIKIGYASLNENGKITGSRAGDQTGKELCIRTWYKHARGWQFVIRAKNPKMAEKQAQLCEQIVSNENVGYDQGNRNSLHKELSKVNYDPSKLKTKCECDCSSLMSVCAYGAGAKLNMSGNAPATSNMKARFKATGQYEILFESKYLTSDKYLKRGDIIVRAGSHTVMALGDGSKVGCPYTKPIKSVKKTSSTNDVAWLQWELNDAIDAGLEVDGKFGPATNKAVLAFWNKLGWNKHGKDDGWTAGKKTINKLAEI